MFTIAAASLFMDFLPLLPSQILLNNILSDIPLMFISTDNVDEELLKSPRKWNLNLISNFMKTFGFLSVIADLVLILPLLFIIKAPVGLFRTAWFVESVVTELASTFSLRTKKTFYKSRPSSLLIAGSMLVAIFAFGITYTRLGFSLFEFEPIPLNILALIMELVVAYFIAVELVKRRFFRKFEL